MDRIRICHVVNIISGKSDGVYTHLKMLFRFVDGNEFCHYLVFQGDPAIEDEVRALGVTVFSLPSLKNKFSLHAFFDLYRIFKENEISIIHAHLIKPYVLVGIVNIFLRKKAIFNYHGNFIDVPVYYNQIERVTYRLLHSVIYIFKCYDRVVVPSEASKRILLAESSLFPRVDVYYNGAITSEMSPQKDTGETVESSSGEKKYTIGVIGRLEPQKRIDIALEIARKLLMSRSDVRFIFAGNGSLEKEVMSLVDSLRLNDSISILGYLPHVKSIMKTFDLVLFSSDWEGMPLAMWEAMSAGVPVVSSDVGGVREILEGEKCGKVYDRRNVNEAVTVLDSLLNDTSLRESMAFNARSAIESKYNEREFRARFESIYRSVMNS